MVHTNSQEQTIYRSLAGQIQLGFYDGGERFPSVQEIARRYQVSCCPAQRALKALERDGLIRLCRGQETAVLAKPYENYLMSPVFQQRICALADLIKALKLISAPICFQGLFGMEISEQLPKGEVHQAKRLYHMFNQSLQSLGSRTAMSLYYDIGAFVESSFQDILYVASGEQEADLYLSQLAESLRQSLRECREHHYAAGLKRLQQMEKSFFKKMEQFLSEFPTDSPGPDAECFVWEPHKGRTKYCDIIAIDLLRKINQGMYPVGALLPNSAVLSDVYHVSEMTIRRVIGILNKLGVTKTRNGVGTSVIDAGDEPILYKIKSTIKDDNFRTFLEALQLLAITCQPVILYTFPHCSSESLDAISRAFDIKCQHKSHVAAISACLQAIVHQCPVVAIREIYGKITLLLLHGSILQFNKAGRETISDWPRTSRTLSESLRAKDYQRFAFYFCSLVKNSFLFIKKQLLKITVDGIDDVQTPDALLNLK